MVETPRTWTEWQSKPSPLSSETPHICYTMKSPQPAATVFRCGTLEAWHQPTANRTRTKATTPLSHAQTPQSTTHRPPARTQISPPTRTPLTHRQRTRSHYQARHRIPGRRNNTRRS